MPTYTYQCTVCDKVHDVVHSIHEYISSCPSCGRNVIKIITSPPAFIFKGGSPTQDLTNSSEREDLEQALENFEGEGGSYDVER